MTTRKGFTLIELMVVIAVIGILAAIALVSLTGIQKNARDSQRRTNLADYATAMARYYQDKQVYPVTAAAGDLANGGATAATGIFLSGGPLVGSGSYIATTLQDPQYGSSVCGGASACNYWALSTASDYAVWTILEAAPNAGSPYYYIRDNGNRKYATSACATAGTYTNCP